MPKSLSHKGRRQEGGAQPIRVRVGAQRVAPSLSVKGSLRSTQFKW